MSQLDPNQVVLSDGRIVTMRETTGRDEIAASQMLGKHFTGDAAGATMYSKAMAMRAIVDIDGKPLVSGPIKFKDFNEFWGGMKTRDSNKLTTKYMQMNSDEDTDPLESAETEESGT